MPENLKKIREKLFLYSMMPKNWLCPRKTWPAQTWHGSALLERIPYWPLLRMQNLRVAQLCGMQYCLRLTVATKILYNSIA